MKWKGFSDLQATILIDLSKSEEDLFNSIDKDGRWGVKRAEKDELVVEESSHENEIKDFYEIYTRTCQYGGINPKSLGTIKKENPVFFVCKKDGEIIAGAVVLLEEEKTVLFLNASKPEFLKSQPNNALYWNIIKWSKAKGFKHFDLGGYQLNAQKTNKLYHINRFKERWGGEIVTSKIYSKNPFYILGRKLIRNSSIAKWIWDRLKGRPTQK